MELYLAQELGGSSLTADAIFRISPTLEYKAIMSGAGSAGYVNGLSYDESASIMYISVKNRQITAAEPVLDADGNIVSFQNFVAVTPDFGDPPGQIELDTSGSTLFGISRTDTEQHLVTVDINTGNSNAVPIGMQYLIAGLAFSAPVCTPATFTSRYPLGLGQTEPVITGRWGGDAIGVKRSFKGHLGVDYATISGTPVAAVACGRVCKIDDVGKSGWGKYVLIHHDLPDGTARHSLYAHLSTVITSEGRDVLAGEDVGLSGATGAVSGPHLHFGILDDKFCAAGKGYSGKRFAESLDSQDAGRRTYYNPTFFVEDWK